MAKLLAWCLFWLSDRSEVVGVNYWFIRCRACWRPFDATAGPSVFVCSRCLYELTEEGE